MPDDEPQRPSPQGPSSKVDPRPSIPDDNAWREEIGEDRELYTRAHQAISRSKILIQQSQRLAQQTDDLIRDCRLAFPEVFGREVDSL